jgi:glutaredoxin 3
MTQETQVTVLTSPTCGYCHAAKNLLQDQDITYEEVDLIKDGEQAQQLLIKSGQRTVPHVFINQKPIGGFTELSKLVRENEFNLTVTKSLN